jgi:mannose-6-phosphate isomerase-like protein (cupin superfamily)
VCYLDLLSYQRCSYHSHAQKSNFFFVIEGELGVKTEWGTTILQTNEFFTVHPPDKHEFQTYQQPTKIIEIAYVGLNSGDIIREAKLLGGMLTYDQMPREKQIEMTGGNNAD